MQNILIRSIDVFIFKQGLIKNTQLTNAKYTHPFHRCVHIQTGINKNTQLTNAKYTHPFYRCVHIQTGINKKHSQ
jgi:hypothetical protein